VASASADRVLRRWSGGGQWFVSGEGGLQCVQMRLEDLRSSATCYVGCFSSSRS
jgi:hypothetical protein